MSPEETRFCACGLWASSRCDWRSHRAVARARRIRLTRWAIIAGLFAVGVLIGYFAIGGAL